MHSDNSAWNASVPSGAEAIRIVKLMRYLSLIMFNFQKFLNLNGIKLSASKILYETIEFHFEFIGIKTLKKRLNKNCLKKIIKKKSLSSTIYLLRSPNADQ